MTDRPGADSAQRASLFRLASRLFLREPDAAMIDALRQDETAQALERLAPGCAAELAGWDEQATEAAAVEYTGLFLVPGPSALSLRAGAWLPEGDEVVGARIDAIAEPLGLDISQVGIGGLPTDHLSVVLALVADLLDQERADRTASEADAEAIVASLLRPWAADFAGFVRQRSQLALFRAAATLLEHLTAPAPV